MNILSLFDGMSCGMLAMLEAGVKVDRYVAYEIDKYAVQTSKHNFPMIEQRGDVFQADFTEFAGFDWLVGGSPCTYWSIAQKNNRETEASGMGWELFSQYVRALRETKPAYFIYENNKSMSKAIRESITETFGFDAICINSALVSAQNRQRLYWVGKRNEDGTYSKCDIEQPEDRGILLRDILESGQDLTGNDKGYCLTASYDGACAWNTIERSQRTMVAEPIYIGAVPDNNGTYMNGKQPSQQYRVYDPDGKGVAVTTCAITNVPERVGCYPSPDGTIKNSQGMRIYSSNGKSVNITAQGGGMGAKTGLYAVDCRPPYAEPCEWDESGKPTKAISAADGKTYTVYEVASYTPPHGWNEGIFTYEKFPNLTTGSSCRQQNVLVEPLTEENEHLLEKPQAFCNQKYEVKNNYITIKGKQYPIKLPAGFYIIRKLTVRECMRLQTVPEWYEFPVSDSQAYKMLGNGWTVSVISHLILSAIKNNP